MRFDTRHLRHWATGLCLALVLSVIPSVGESAKEPSVEELKARVADTNVRDRPSLCIQISERQLADADKLYTAGDDEKAQANLADVVAFSELARDYSIQAHKHEKQSEIAIRKMTRKLADIKRGVSFAEQKPIQDAIDRLQRIRDDLLFAMFPKGEKK